MSEAPQLSPIAEFELDEHGPTDFIALPNGSVIGWRFGSSSLWTLDVEASLVCLASVPGPLGPVSHVWALSDGSLAVCERDHAICVLEAETWATLARLVGHEEQVNAVHLLRDGQILSCSNDASVRIWNARDGVCESVLVRSGSISALSSEQTLDAAYNAQEFEDGTILVWYGKALWHAVTAFAVWDRVARRPVFEIVADELSPDSDYRSLLASLERSQVGRVVAVLEGGEVLSMYLANEVRLWDASTGRALDSRFDLHEHVEGAVRITRKAVDGDPPMRARGDIYVWSRRVDYPKARGTNVLACWDDKSAGGVRQLGDCPISEAMPLTPGRMLTTHYDRIVRVWDTATKDPIATLKGSSAIALPNGSIFSWTPVERAFGSPPIPGAAWLWPGVERRSTKTMSWDDYFEHIADLKERHEGRERAGEDEEDGAEDGEPLALDVTVTRWSEQDHEQYDDEGTYFYHRRCTAFAELHVMGQLVAVAELIQHYDEGFEELCFSMPSSNERSDSLYELIEGAGDTSAAKLLRRCVTVPRLAESESTKRAREGASYGFTVRCEGPKRCGELMPAPGKACPKCGTSTKQRLFHEGCRALNEELMQRIRDSLTEDKRVHTLGDGHPVVRGHWRTEKPLAERVVKALAQHPSLAELGIAKLGGPDDRGDVFVDRGPGAKPCFLVVASDQSRANSGAASTPWLLQLIITDIVAVDMLRNGTSETAADRCNDYNRRSAFVRRYWDDRHVHIASHVTVPAEPVDEASAGRAWTAFAELWARVTTEEKFLVEEFEHFANREECDEYEAPPDSEDD